MGALNQLVAARASEDLQAVGAGYKAWNYPPFSAAAPDTPVSQTIYAMGIGLRAGTVITNLVFFTVTGGTSTAPTSIICGLADSTGLILKQTAELKSSAIWTSRQLAIAPLTAAYTILADGLYYILFWENGAFAGTALQLGDSSTIIAGSNAVGSGKPIVAIQTGQAAFPANGATATLAFSTSAFPFFAGVS